MSEHDDRTLSATLATAGRSSLGHTLHEPELLERLRDPAIGLVRLRHYVLLERLGAGGMGVVFAAYDETLERKVAVKLLRSASSVEGQLRLAREAQAMARLSHPNVVQIYEIGEFEGLTFIVMEFVDGVTLGRWREQAARSREQILAVFVAAGRGLAAAHEKGLVHRDFKPDNVLIGSDGRVLVTDFGIARTETMINTIEEHIDDADSSVGVDVDMTATGALLGTPAYMAPEQFSGDKADARTDQFSFCVALWEALYGKRPFSASTIAALSVAVTSGDLQVPDRGDVPSWLHAVVVRGLAVEPERRFPSMTAVLRALEDDPTYRRRIRTVAGVLIVTVAAVAVGLFVERRQVEADAEQRCTAEGQTIAAEWNEARQAELGASFEASELSFAQSAWAHLRVGMDEYTQAWTELRTSVCRETYVEHTRDEESYAAIAACLDDDREIFAGLTTALREADAETITHATLAVAHLPPLVSCTSEAWLAQRIEAPGGEQGEQVVALRTRLHEIAAMRLTGKTAVAAEQAERALTEAERLGWPPLIAEVRLVLGDIRVELGDYDVARPLIEQAFADALVAGHERVALEAATIATTLTGYLLGDAQSGLVWAHIAEALIQRMDLRETTHAAALETAIGHIHWTRGEFEEAEASYTQALHDYETVLGPDHPSVADALANVGYLYKERGATDDALRYYERALDIAETTLGPEHRNVGTTLIYIGEIASGRGEHERALAAFTRALTIYEQAYSSEHPAVASALANLGWTHNAIGRHDLALAEFRRALTINQASFGPEHFAVATSYTGIGMALTGLGRHGEALEAQLEALRIHEATQTPDPTQVGLALDNIARAQQVLGQPRAALAAATRALALFEGALGPTHRSNAIALVLIGEAELSLDHPEQARAAFERAVAIREAKPGARQQLAEAQFGLARALERLGEDSAASTVADAAAAGYREAGPEHASALAAVEAWRSASLDPP